jgi:peptide-methionine (S)-S-oxide reductase
LRVRFDPDVLPLDELLTAFFTLHDPTTPNRQGADVGTQYRSVILWERPEQEPVVRGVIRDLEAQKIWPDPVVTEVGPLRRFHEAEEYHDDYYRRNPNQPYCQVVISPKLAKLRARFGDRMS